MKTIMKLFRLIFTLLVIIGVAFAGLIIYAVLTDYKPGEQEIITTSENSSVLKDSLSITLLTWNIGYAGLDKEMDFFFDGGTKVITPKSNCIQNLKSIGNFIKQNDSIDFILLQEVDRNSKRSYYFNQFDTISSFLKNHTTGFATNYNVFFVPKPFTKPMGKVLSGIAVLSKPNPKISTRYSLPGDFGFPTQLFWLDRCLLVNRYPLENGKELIIINVHNEAFDEGNIRISQMEYLKTLILDEFSKGNYIIAGGDWNQSPPGFEPSFNGNVVNTDQMKMEDGFMPEGWKWVYDSSNPTNRSVNAAYDPAITTTTVIDFFLISPNIQAVDVKSVHLGFEFSDHNPVIMKVKI